MPEQRPSRSSGESLLREERLRRRAEFLRCYEQGRRRHGRLVTVYILQGGREATHARLGITVTRKVGGAVIRHRIKRRIREIYRRWNQRRHLPPCDILVHVKPAARQAEFSRLRDELEDLLQPLVRNRGQVG